jgi:predicted HTH domain antitoxin
MNAGDVIWVDFPPGAGRAQAGRRPAIIAQTAAASDRLPTVLLIPLTTQQDALRFPGTVLVERDAFNIVHAVGIVYWFLAGKPSHSQFASSSSEGRFTNKPDGCKNTIPNNIYEALRVQPNETAARLKLELAVSLYSQKALNVGKAAELAEMGLLDFNDVLAERGIPMHYGEKELAEDISYARSHQ